MSSALSDVESLTRVLNYGRAEDRVGTLARMGEILLSIQDAEESLRFTMTFVLQKDGGLTLEKLEAQTAHEQSKTIGYFLGQMRHRVDVHPGVDAKFVAFLTLRNQMIHHIRDVPGWGLSTPEELSSANDFLTEVHVASTWVRFFLGGLMKSWASQVGLVTKHDDQPELAFLSDWQNLAEYALDEKSRNSPEAGEVTPKNSK